MLEDGYIIFLVCPFSLSIVRDVTYADTSIYGFSGDQILKKLLWLKKNHPVLDPSLKTKLAYYHFPLLQKDSYPVESKLASLQEKRPSKPSLSLIFLSSLIPYPFGPCPLRRAPNLLPILPIQTRKVLKLYCYWSINYISE